jgi:hypothetical protein
MRQELEQIGKLVRVVTTTGLKVHLAYDGAHRTLCSERVDHLAAARVKVSCDRRRSV